MKNTLKKAAKHSLIAVTSLFYFSCANNIQPLEEPTPPLPVSGNIPITISGRILQVQAHTRITDNKFDNDNAIGLYVLAQPENLSGSRHIDNMRLVYSSDGFTPEEEIYYPKGEGKCDFISYYPYQEEGIIQGGMIPKLENAFEAIRHGVCEVIITRADCIGQKDRGTRIVG